MKVIILDPDVKIPKQPIVSKHVDKIQRIAVSMAKHCGDSVIYTRKELRTPIVQLWDIAGITKRFVNLSKECYAPDGSFRQWRHTSVSFQSLLCGDEIIEFLPEGF